MMRRLTVILAADVAGYSRLVGQDEEGTLRRLGTYREVIDGLVAQHHGRVFGSAGDSVVAEFSSPVEAVRCAAEIQRELKHLNRDLPRDHRMQFRIGVNLGDVIVEGENLLGDGVNVAARLETLAEAGGICLSQSVFDQIGKKLELGYKFLGEKQLKNIAEPIRAYRVLMEPSAIGGVERETRQSKRRLAVAAAAIVVIGLVSTAAWLRPWEPSIATASVERMAHPLPDKPSVAVLPFTNLSGDSAQEAFADGMTDDLITDLSKVSGLFVISRNSSFTFKDKPTETSAVAEKLGVRYVLEGSVRRSANKVRVNAQLVDATTGGHLWAERYDGDITDYFAVQDSFVRKIVGALSLNLTKVEEEEIARGQSANAEAREAFQKGWQEYSRYNAASNAKAARFFRRATELDPKYGRAFSALSMAYIRGCQWRWNKEMDISPGAAFAKATAFLLSARENESAMTKVAASQIKLYNSEHGKALTEAARAIALDPNDPEAQLAMGMAMITTGKPMAGLEFVKSAMRLNPNHPTHYPLALALGYFSMNDMDQAAKTLNVVLKKDPTAVDLAPLLAASYANLGRKKEAHAALRLWNPEANDAELRAAHRTYHFPYSWDFSQSEFEQKLSDGLVLAGLPVDMTVAGLLDQLRHGETPERIDAVKNLAAFGALAVDAVPDLIVTLENDNKTLRRNAINTLGRIGPSAKAALPALETLRDKKIAFFPVKRAIRSIRGH